MLFLKKWREFLEGGNDIRFFLKKGNHPIEQEEQVTGQGAGDRA